MKNVSLVKPDGVLCDTAAVPDPPAKRPGRPANPEPGSRVTVWLTTRQHDRLIALARQRDLSVSATTRQLLVNRLKP